MSEPLDLRPYLDAPADFHRVRAWHPRKHRGWRRRVRELDRWAVAERDAFDPDRIAGYQAVRIRFDRWDAFPLGVRRRMVAHLVDIHDAWHARMRHLPSPKYLGIWLFLPHMYDSQVVASAGPDAEWYAQRHEPSASPASLSRRDGPPLLYHGRPCDLVRFEWTREARTQVDRLSSFADADVPHVLRRAARAVPVDDGDVEVTLVHHAWYGRLPAAVRG